MVKAVEKFVTVDSNHIFDILRVKLNNVLIARRFTKKYSVIKV